MKKLSVILSAVVATAFAITTTALEIAQGSDGRFALPLVLFLDAVVLLLAAILLWPLRTAWSFGLDASSLLLLCSGSILSSQLVVRLFAVDHFGGRVSALSFGEKCDEQGCGPNEAFTPSFASFGHFIQGSLSFLLFRSLDSVMGQLPLRAAKDAAAPFVSGYPVYNTLKRAIRSAPSFAASSFANNACEWALGFALGVCLGVLTSAVVAWRERDGRHVEVKPLPTRFVQIATMARCISGILLFLATITAAFLFGLSWDRVGAEERGMDSSDPEDTAATAVMLLVPLFGAALLGLSQREKVLRERMQCNGGNEVSAPAQPTLELSLPTL